MASPIHYTPFRRLLAALPILLAAALPGWAAAQAPNPWYSATLEFSPTLVAMQGPDFSFGAVSPNVSLIRQGNLVTGLNLGLGQITLQGQDLLSADPASWPEEFTMTAGLETLTFQFGGVSTNYQQWGQLGMTLGIAGSPAPIFATNNGITLVSQNLSNVEPFTWPINGNPTGRFVASGLRLQFIPFSSDPAASLLDAISRGNGNWTPPMTSSELYALDIGTLTIAAVPEPETYAMLLAGLGLLGAATARRRGPGR